MREVPSSISRYELIPSVKIKAALTYPLNGALMERGVKRAHHRPQRFSSQVMTISGYQNKRTLLTLPFNLTSQLIKIKLISLLQFITI